MDEAEQLASALHAWTPKQKHDADLVRNLCRNIEQQVIALIPLMPSHWDGHELRELLAEKFAYERSPSMTQKNSYRRRAYRKIAHAYDSKF